MLRTGFATSALGALCLAAALVLSLSPPASAVVSGKPTLTVDPPTGLTDGQVVTATWSNLPQGSAVYLQECDAHPVKPSDCGQYGTSHGQPWITDQFPVDANGGGSATYLLTGGAINTKPNGDPTGTTFYCDYQHTCSLIMLVDDGTGVVKQQALAKLTFAKPATACPVNPTGQYVVGSGAGSDSLLLSRWEATVCQPPISQFVQYLASNSVQGLNDFSMGNVSYAVTGVPMDASQRAAAIAAGRSFTYAPLVADPVVFAYNLTDRQTHTQVQDLKLSPRILALIFNGQLTSWNDPEIAALNPAHVTANGVSSLPANVQAIGRADSSAQTFGVTSWFEAQAKQAWESAGPVFANAGATTIMPSTGRIGLDTGGQKVALDVAFPSGGDKNYTGWIGYTDAATAAFYGLPTVKVENNAGGFVGPNAAGVRAGLTHLITNGDGVTARPDYSTMDPAVYPLASIQYMVVPTSVFDSPVVHFDGVQGTILRKFLTWAVSTGQDDMRPGYIPLNDDLSQQALTAAEKIPTTGSASSSPSQSSSISTTPYTPSSFSPASYSAGATGTLSLPPSSGTLAGGSSTVPSLAAEGPLGRGKARLVLPGLVGAGVAGVLIGPFLSWRAAKAEDDADVAVRDTPGDEADHDGEAPRRRRLRLPRRKRDDA